MSKPLATQSAGQPPRSLHTTALAFGGLLLALIWSYWSTLGVLAQKWAHDPQYSHGYLVPLFSIAFLWMRRDTFPQERSGGHVWGLALLVAGTAIRLVGAYFYLEWLDWISIVPSVAGLACFCWGWSIFRWAIPAVLFLTFMIPLPYRLETTMKGPLRRLGTVTSTYVMQTVGLPAFAEANVIVLDNQRIGVAEACSGLRMLFIFFALATAVAMLSLRPLWERAIIVLSAVPIALISNITRITVTGILYETVGSEIAEHVFHDLAGWLMMPLGLALLGGELWLMSQLFIVEQETPVAPVAGMGHSTKPRPAGNQPAAVKPDWKSRKTGVP